MDVNKKTFLKVYNNHKPSKWIKWGYKYFSSSTIEENLMPVRMIKIFLSVLFLGGFLGTVLSLPMDILTPIVIGYTCTLLILSLYLLSVDILNKSRINKIRKELGNIAIQTYNEYVEKYL
ncbi:MAG: hypothetical protein ACOC1K_05475 [Nanoarchaeota archaeon]